MSIYEESQESAKLVEQPPARRHNPILTQPQRHALARLNHIADWDEFAYAHSFDLPSGYVCGWCLDKDRKPWLFVGVSPEGSVSS